MLTIGIKVYDDLVKPVGFVTAGKQLHFVVSTIIDDQFQAEIEFYLSNDPSPLGFFLIENIPNAKAGVPEILVTLWIDLQNNIHVTASIDNRILKTALFSYSIETVESRKSPYIEGRHTTNTLDIKEQQAAFKNPDNSPSLPELKKPAELALPENKTINPVFLILPIILVAGLLIMFLVPYCKAANPLSDSKNDALKPVKTIAPLSETQTSLLSISQTTQPALTATNEPQVEKIDIILVNTQAQSNLPIYFYPDSIEMLPEYAARLDQLASVLSSYKDKITIEISGHAAQFDSLPDPMVISLKRAQFIKEFLIKKDAVLSADCSVKGLGYSQPVYIGSDPDRHYLNRRVEITISAK